MRIDPLNNQEEPKVFLAWTTSFDDLEGILTKEKNVQKVKEEVV